MRARIAGMLALALAGGGCSLLVSLDSLHGSDAATVDAALDITVDDAPSDATLTDAPIDSPSFDAGPDSFCPTLDDAGTVFCDDFDDSDAAMLFSRWSKLVASNGGVVVRVTSDASAPFGVEFTLPTDDGGPQAELAHTFLKGPSTYVHYSFDLRVVSFPMNNLAFNISPVEFAGSANVGATNFIRLTSNSASLSEQLPTDSGTFQTFPHVLMSSIAQNTWVNVRIEWTILDGGAINAQVFFDGLPVMLATPIDPRSVFTFPYLVAGMSYEDALSDGAKIDIDNVAFSFE